MSSLALNYLIHLLARRDYSSWEIQQKMQTKGFSEQEIVEALQHCQNKHWQSDFRFAQSYLNMRAQRGYGPLRIKQELCQLKGVEQEIVNQVLAESEWDWAEQALQVLRKKFPNFSHQQEAKNKQKIFRYMLSHGFQADDFKDYIGQGEDVAEEWD